MCAITDEAPEGSFKDQFRRFLILLVNAGNKYIVSWLLFLSGFDASKAHYAASLILDRRFAKLCHLKSFRRSYGIVNISAIVQGYTQKLISLAAKCTECKAGMKIVPHHRTSMKTSIYSDTFSTMVRRVLSRRRPRFRDINNWLFLTTRAPLHWTV